MADLMSKDFTIVTRPSEENYCMHIPEGDDDNIGRCGVQGVFDRVYSNQQLITRIETPGSFIPFYEFKHEFGGAAMTPHAYPTGARFTLEPTFLNDVNGTAVTDALNPMGGEEAYSIGRWKHIELGSSNGGGNFRAINNVRVTPLVHATNVNSDFNYVAIACWTERYDINHIWFSLMKNKKRATTAPSITWPYIWEEAFESVSFPGDTAIGDSVVDIVEFDDGSLFLATTLVDSDGYVNLNCYRSVDYGQTWFFCGQIDKSVYDSVVASMSVAIERINERLVVVFVSNESDTQNAYMYYSDDFGMTWTLGEKFRDAVSSISISHVSMAKGRDNVLYIAFNHSPYLNQDIGVYMRRTLDGANLSAPVSTGVKMDLFSLVEDIAGTWMLIGRYRNAEERKDCSAVAATDLFTAAGHTFVDTNMVQFDYLNNETYGVVTGRTYFVRDRAGDDFKLALTSGGAAIDITGAISSSKIHEVYTKDGEIAVVYNEKNPYTDTWSAVPGSPVLLDYKFITQNSVSGGRYQWKDIGATSISNHLFVDVLAIKKDLYLTTQWKSELGEMKLGMWSGITADIKPSGTSHRVWDDTYFANHYPSFDDLALAKYPYMGGLWNFAASDVGNTSLLGADNSSNRSFLLITNGTDTDDIILYWMEDSQFTRALGAEIRCGIKVGLGIGMINFFPVSDGNSISASILFDADANQIRLYDNEDDSVSTFTPVNWTVSNKWNVFHIIYQGTSVYVYRSTDQYAELLNFELVGSKTDFTIVANIVDTSRIYWGALNTASVHPATTMYVEFFFTNYTGINWTLPIDQDTDLLGRRAYFNPVGLYGGMSVKFDGAYAVEDDQWLIETGAIYEMENIFNPSPSVTWKRSSLLAASVDEVFVWKQKDSGGTMFQTITGFAVFGRNWPACKLEGSANGTNYTTIFNSLTTGQLQYILKLDASGNSYYNQLPVTIPADCPPLHVNRFASTPEISYYLMVTEGTEKYHIYKILENDEDRFYLDVQFEHGVTSGETVYIFSDRFYFDLSTGDRDSTTFVRSQYNYFRLTIYGTEGGTPFTFPAADNDQMKLGSIHLGRVYDLPDEEWNVSMSLQPAMAVTESRSSRKEYKRVGIARRIINLAYTGIVERGFGINPVVDLNRSLGWGENPLVFIDDADILSHGESTGPTVYSTWVHPNPILARMVNGYSMSRVAYSLEAENQGDATENLVRNIVDISGISLEEVV
jgi:hypothetical protein